MKKERVKIYVAQRNVTSLEAVDWSKLIEEHHSARRIVRILDDFDFILKVFVRHLSSQSNTTTANSDFFFFVKQYLY